ncbi:zinc-binding dehydrogenase [Nocardioides deserti]|uniref:Zinc-binding dehydrogenase n=2 Tax=Nocardioides deserti TaxID=1588644 RepID=A0ABR6U6H7_9ACTN|nr:zinc-binding dehydrogenase [Nocardioides deserti]
MKAWRFQGTGEPLVLADVPEPTAGPGQVVVDIHAAGLCHTDVGILHDPIWAAEIAEPPLTLGHELAGTISEVGDGVTGWAVGDRVGVSPAGTTRPGLGRDGGYSSKCIAHPADLVRMPAGLSFELAAMGTDAGRAPYRAVVVRGEVQAGQRVGVIGLGGLGQIGARIAVLKGAEVYVAEVKESLWPLAEDLGASGVAKSITEFVDQELDLIVDFAGFGSTTADAIETVKPFGRVVQVGMGVLESTISTNTLILKQVTLMGSRGGTVQDIADVYDMFTSRDLSPELTSITFGDIPAALDRLHRGEAVGRYVAVMR